MALQVEQQLQQGIAVGLVQTRGGFIQDQQFDFLGQGLGDFNQLLLAHTQVGDERIG